MSVRLITYADSLVLAELHRQSIVPSWTETDFQLLLKNSFYGGWIALADDQPAGFILVSLIKPEAEILTIVVLPSYRRQGIGTLLLNHLRQYCLQHHISKIFLEVDEHNLAAQKLYRSQGFQQTGNRKDYYTLSSGELSDALVMSLEL